MELEAILYGEVDRAPKYIVRMIASGEGKEIGIVK